jgi:hypothetical protein
MENSSPKGELSDSLTFPTPQPSSRKLLHDSATVVKQMLLLASLETHAPPLPFWAVTAPNSTVQVRHHHTQAV